MIPGYNHNILYKDVVYHIQTEDSGVENPHIITHVFVGGNIIDSRKTSYADIVNTDRLSEMLVELMQDQHKNMLKDLIKGNLDERIGERSAGAGSLNGPAPLNVEAGGQDRVSFGMSKSSAKPAEPITTNAAATPDTATPAPVAPAPMAPAPVASAPTTETPFASPSQSAASVLTLSKVPTRQAPSAATTLSSSPFGAPEPSPDTASSFFGSAPAAPQQRIIEADTLEKAFDSPNEDAVDSIFGEDLISEKSLDEVILSYLADDMA